MNLKIHKAIGCLLILCLFFSCSKNSDNINPSPKGKIKKYTYLTNSNGSANYYYDNNLHLSNYKWIDLKGNIDQHITYTYSNNKISEVNIYGPIEKDVPLEKMVEDKYFYSKDGKLEFMVQNHITIDKLVNKYLFTSNDKSQLIKLTHINLNPAGDITSDTLYHEYDYDNVGNIILITTKKRRVPNEQIEILYRIEYSYDNKKSPYQGIQAHYVYDIHRYISPNNIIREVFYGGGGTVPMYENTYEYEYNSEDKPVKEIFKKNYENGYEQNYIREALIEYY